MKCSNSSDSSHCHWHSWVQTHCMECDILKTTQISMPTCVYYYILLLCSSKMCTHTSPLFVLEYWMKYKGMFSTRWFKWIDLWIVTGISVIFLFYSLTCATFGYTINYTIQSLFTKSIHLIHAVIDDTSLQLRLLQYICSEYLWKRGETVSGYGSWRLLSTLFSPTCLWAAIFVCVVLNMRVVEVLFPYVK